MSDAVFIAGDWGTSRLRLCLCGPDGTVLARREGPGIAEARGRAATVFTTVAADWDNALPVLLSGMVGSSIGWREVPYLPCPAAPAAIAKGALQWQTNGRRVAIMPGLSCHNASGLFDVMRGEETQLLGAVQLEPTLSSGRHLVCLPGTHAKWALIDDGTVTRFQTALSGELFALLVEHSILAHGAAEVSADHAAFGEGAATARKQTQAGLLHLLFSTRSRQFAGEISKEQAASYLSGLIIGEDVAAALRLFGSSSSVGVTQVTLICAPALTALYTYVLRDYGLAVRGIDGDAASLAGLTFLYTRLFGA